MTEYAGNANVEIVLDSEAISELKKKFVFKDEYDLEFKLRLMAFTYYAIKRNHGHMMKMTQKSLERMLVSSNELVSAIKALTPSAVKIVNSLLNSTSVPKLIELFMKLEREAVPLVATYSSKEAQDGATVANSFLAQRIEDFYREGTGNSLKNGNIFTDDFQEFFNRCVEIIEI